MLRKGLSTPLMVVISSLILVVSLAAASGILVKNSSNMCIGCHGNNYKEYCNLLPSDPLSDLPATMDDENWTDIKITVEVISTGLGGPQSYFLIDILRVTLTCDNDYVDIPSPQQQKNNIYPDDKVVFEWTVKGIVGGADTLTFSLYAHNPHKSCTTTDIHSYGVTILSNKERPSPPRNLVTGAGNGFVELDWEEPTDDGGAVVTGYKIYRGSSPGTEEYQYSVNSLPRSFNDSSVTNGNHYYYYVTAVNSMGESDPSNEAEANPLGRPSYPRNLQATAGNGFVELNWEPPADDRGAAISGYNIYRGESSGSEIFHHQVGGDIATYNDTGLENNVTYYYLVTAENAIGESPPAVEVSATPQSGVSLPSRPRNLYSSAGDGFVELTWEPPEDSGGVPIINYRIYRGMTDGSESFLDDTPDVETHYNDTTVENGISYHYFVTALNSLGESAGSAGTAADPLGVPGAPGNLSAESGDGYVVLSWEEPDGDGGSPIISYDIHRGLEPTVMADIDSVDASTFSFNDSSVENGITYYYGVTAWNDVGGSGTVPIVMVRPDIRHTPPSSPRNLIIRPGYGHIDLIWQHPLMNGSSPLTEYRIYRGGSSGTGTFLTATVSRVTSYRDSSVTDGDSYSYYVTAVNSAGEGKPGNTVEITYTIEDFIPEIVSSYPGVEEIKTEGNEVVILSVDANDDEMIQWFVDDELYAAGIRTLSYPVTEPGIYNVKVRVTNTESGLFVDETWEIESSENLEESSETAKRTGARAPTQWPKDLFLYGGMMVLAGLGIYFIFFYRKRGR